MKDQSSATVAKLLFEDYIREHGVPVTLHTDQGRQFEANVVKQLCKTLGIKKSRSSPYHPQGAGIVERANRVIKDQLAKYLAERGGEWDQYLHQLELAYNTSVNSSTGLTPFFMVHGREARLPASLTPPDTDPPTSHLQYTNDLRQRLHTAFLYARSATITQERGRNSSTTREREVWSTSLVILSGSMIHHI